jgi:hypothetical protein
MWTDIAKLVGATLGANGATGSAKDAEALVKMTELATIAPRIIPRTLPRPLDIRTPHDAFTTLPDLIAVMPTAGGF